MKTTVQKKQIVSLSNALANLYKEKMNAKASYAIVKNKEVIDSELGIIRDAYSHLNVSDEFREYEKAKAKVLEEYANKDKDNKPVIINNVYDIPKEAETKINKLIIELQNQEKFKTSIQEREEIEKDFQEMLEEKIELDLLSLKIDLLPDLSPVDLDAISCFIID